MDATLIEPLTPNTGERLKLVGKSLLLWMCELIFYYSCLLYKREYVDGFQQILFILYLHIWLCAINSDIFLKVIRSKVGHVVTKFYFLNLVFFSGGRAVEVTGLDSVFFCLFFYPCASQMLACRVDPVCVFCDMNFFYLPPAHPHVQFSW